MERLRSFASLAWYDACIEFLFKLAAKTSEPLLAIGIVYSAADVLSHGHLGYGNQGVQNWWAITQALAIESSGGVVLVYGLLSLRERDHIKASLYLPLSALLAICGGVMLFMQLSGFEQQGNSPFMLGLFALRCAVSIGYIYLCRAKHIRFAGLASETSPLAVEKLSNETMQIILSKLERIDHLEQMVTRQQVRVTQEALEQPPALLPEGERASSDGEQRASANGDLIRELLAANPYASDGELAAQAGCSRSTANKWKNKVLAQKGQTS